MQAYIDRSVCDLAKPRARTAAQLKWKILTINSIYNIWTSFQLPNARGPWPIFWYIYSYTNAIIYPPWIQINVFTADVTMSHRVNLI